MSVASDALTFDGTTGPHAGGHPRRDRPIRLCLAGLVHVIVLCHLPGMKGRHTWVIRKRSAGFSRRLTRHASRFPIPNTEMPGLQHFARHGCFRVEML